MEKVSFTEGSDIRYFADSRSQKIDTGLDYLISEFGVTSDGKFIMATDSAFYIGFHNPDYRH